MTEIRIGSGPTGSPLQPPAPKRRGAGVLMVAAAVVVLVAAVAAGAAYVASRSSTTAADPAGPTSGTFVVPTADVGEEAGCVLLMPSLTDAIDQMGELGKHPDGTTMQAGTLRSALANLEGAKGYLPEDMRPEVEAMLAPMRQVDAILKREAPDGPLDMEGFKDGGRRLLSRCLKYGT